MHEVERAQDPLPYGQYDDEWRQLAPSIHVLLTMYTEGTPPGIVHKVSNQNGPASYRRLPAQPTEHGEHTHAFDQSPGIRLRVGVRSIPQVDRLRSRSGRPRETANETLSDDRSASITQKAPEELNNHILLARPMQEIQWTGTKQWHRTSCWHDSRWQEDSPLWTSAQCGSSNHQARQRQGRLRQSRGMDEQRQGIERAKARTGRTRECIAQTTTSGTRARARARVTRRKRSAMDTAASADSGLISNVTATPEFTTWKRGTKTETGMTR